MFRKTLRLMLIVLGFFLIPINTYADGEKQDYYFIYNSGAMTTEDIGAIKNYVNSFDKVKIKCVLKDIGTADEYQIYNYLKKQPQVDAIQIFGTDKDVPSFKVHHNVVMSSGVEEIRFRESPHKYNYETDYFYNNLQNEISQIKEFTIKNYGHGNVQLDLTPQIKVIRLPITKGDYPDYLKKYSSYIKAHPGVLPLTSFYDSAFGDHPMSIDHLNYFIQGNLDYEGGIIDRSIYNLFGQKEFYDMALSTLGEYNKENMKKMNQKQVQNFVFAGHGDKNSFLYQRKSELNSKNIDNVLGDQYYNMNAISCNIAEGMDHENFVYKMLKGKGVYVMALTDFYYYGDLRFQKDMAYTLDDDNFRYFYYEYYRNLYNGINLTDSFYRAQQAYVSQVHEKEIEDISQAQLSNLIFCHNFGVLEYENIEKAYTYKDILTTNQKNELKEYMESITKEIEKYEPAEKIRKEEIKRMINKEYEFGFSRDHIDDIHTELDGIKINKINCTRKGKEIIVNIDFDSIQKGRVMLRSTHPNGGDGPNVFLNDFKPGNNKLEFPIQLKLFFEFDVFIDLFCHGGENPSDMSKPGGGNHFITIKAQGVEY